MKLYLVTNDNDTDEKRFMKGVLMAKFCRMCGTQLDDSSRFCNNCGAEQTVTADNPQPMSQQPVYQAIPQPSPQQSVYQAVPQPVPQQVYQTNPINQYPIYAGNGKVREGIPVPGYSDRINDPEIVAAMKKNRRLGIIFGFIIIPLPLIGFIIYGQASGEMEMKQSLLYGGIVSGVFLLFALFSFIKERAKNSYDAVVLDKKSELTYRHKNTDHGNSKERYMEYTTFIRRADGKKKKIVEHEGSQIWAYDYLNVGDQFRYHPELHFPYELYDKSKAKYIACVSCITKNPKEADRCKKCGLPLLK